MKKDIFYVKIFIFTDEIIYFLLETPQYQVN